MTSHRTAHVLIVGRSAAERSAIAYAMHRAGLQTQELERASDLTPQTLRQAQIVVALDQHAYLTRLLQEAQSYGATPLLLPIGSDSSTFAPDASHLSTRADQAPAPPVPTPTAHTDASPDASPDGASSVAFSAHHYALLARAQQLAATAAPKDPALLRHHYAALAQQILRLPQNPAAIAPHDPDDPQSERTIAVRDIYEVMPEHDPRNQDPGPLPELDTPASTGWVAVFAGIVALGAAAYLLLAPPTERELQEVRAQQEAAAEKAGYDRAAHITYRARAVATHSPLDLQTEPVRCRRLLDEGRLELAEKVCGRAYKHDGAAAAPLAQVLLRSQAAHEALALLQERVVARPDDLEAWQLLATAARQVGDDRIETEALQTLIALHARQDPTAPLQERLDALQKERPDPLPTEDPSKAEDNR